MKKRKRGEEPVEVKVEIDLTTYMAGIIDASLEEFIKTVEKDRVPIGVLLNTKMLLISMYEELVNRKNALIDKIKSGELSKEDPQLIDLFKGIYAELVKIEQKVLYIDERVKELQDID